jgi:hypothetical protein
MDDFQSIVSVRYDTFMLTMLHKNENSNFHQIHICVQYREIYLQTKIGRKIAVVSCE